MSTPTTAQPFSVWRTSDYTLPPRAVALTDLCTHAATWWLAEQMDAWEGMDGDATATVDAAPADAPYGVSCQILDGGAEGMTVETALRVLGGEIEHRAAMVRLARMKADPNLRDTRARWLCHARAYPDHPPFDPDHLDDSEMIEAFRTMVGSLTRLQEVATLDVDDDLAYVRWCLDVLRDEAEREAEKVR